MDVGFTNEALEKSIRETFSQACAISIGKYAARKLADFPPNICTPDFVVDKTITEFAKQKNFSVNVLEPKHLLQLGMHALLAVSAGSTQPARVAVVHYKGGSQRGSSPDNPVVLIGKGITFDSGGLSIKSREAMEYMKYDMCGSAAVFGVLKSVAELQLEINLIGLLVMAENMPGGNALRPGDIINTMSGQTVEVLNTDAEGRLILCDALTYVERFQPRAVIDVATLTGAVSIALGPKYTGLFSSDESLVEQLSAAAESTEDRVWRLPMDPEYDRYLDSNSADMANVGIKQGGSIIAACFLQRFAKKFPWAHLDIAGSACNESKKQGATGRPVSLLTQYLIDLAGQQFPKDLHSIISH